MPHHFNMSNKYVLCQFNKTRMYFSIVKFHKRPKVKIFKIIDVGEKKRLHINESHPKNYS